MEGKDKSNDTQNSKDDNLNAVPKKNQGIGNEEAQNQWHDHADTDKYLALEQEGVKYTSESHSTNYSDYPENGEQTFETWNPTGENSRNSEAFNQDDAVLNDNIDLDEDQNLSISSDDI